MSRDVEVVENESDTGLYGRDFYAWTQEQAALLRSGQLQALDAAHILEEIETLGRSECAALKSAYRLICSHLLKINYQPWRRTRSWINTVDRERSEVAEILGENPGLKPGREEVFAKAYALARRDAARELSLPSAIFPNAPPFSLAECESTNSIPTALRDHAVDKLNDGQQAESENSVEAAGRRGVRPPRRHRACVYRAHTCSQGGSDLRRERL